MNHVLHILWTGIVVWLVPIIISMFFFTPNGELATDVFLFKSIMILSSSLVGVILLWYLFKGLVGKYLTFGFIIGLSWFGVNCFLDLIILVPMSNMPLNQWFIEIGMRYFNMIIMSGGIGWVLQTKENRNV